MIVLTDLFDLVQPFEIFRRLLAEIIQPKGHDRAVDAVLSGCFQNSGYISDITVLVQAPSKNPHESVSEPVCGTRVDEDQASPDHYQDLLHRENCELRRKDATSGHESLT